MKISGIYKIENIINGKVYIGSAVDIKGRWARHKHDLLRNKHCSLKLQRSFNKYGLENFKFSVIKEVTELTALLVYEQAFLDKYRCVDIGFNTARMAGNTLGVKPTEAQLLKRALLSNKDLENILRLRKDGVHIKAIASEYGCAVSSLYNYIKGRSEVSQVVSRGLPLEAPAYSWISKDIEDKIVEMYSARNDSKDICEAFNLKRATLSALLKRRGFENPFKHIIDKEAVKKKILANVPRKLILEEFNISNPTYHRIKRTIDIEFTELK